MVIEDKEKVMCLIDGKMRNVGKFSHSLRMNLYEEHFSLTAEQAQDPVAANLKHLITTRAHVE